MTYVIVGTCINDGACVSACPVDCIHPSPTEKDYVGADMLYIDPDLCVNCNACAEICPVAAIMRDTELPPDLEHYKQINAEFARWRACRCE